MSDIDAQHADYVRADVTPEARSGLVHALHKVFTDCRHASGPGLPALVDAVIGAGWRSEQSDIRAALQACWDEYNELMPDALYEQVKTALGIRVFTARNDGDDRA